MIRKLRQLVSKDHSLRPRDIVEVSQIKDNIKPETPQEDEIYFELEDNEEYELESLQEANEMTKSEEELHEDSVSYSYENYDECENTPQETFVTELEEQEG
ncbi:CLUMA_CG008431, isoform A [Clunio marinus]|uniref:CLUMA_CG008431, isoform A n=1 Tax=Clunio marinus TaxID=568069 RepID=A0A1J1I3S2_9DIPT|nr:CLUMA_CG008431, isoform A [Clunio marinus]